MTRPNDAASEVIQRMLNELPFTEDEEAALKAARVALSEKPAIPDGWVEKLEKLRRLSAWDLYNTSHAAYFVETLLADAPSQSVGLQREEKP